MRLISIFWQEVLFKCYIDIYNGKLSIHNAFIGKGKRERMRLLSFKILVDQYWTVLILIGTRLIWNFGSLKSFKYIRFKLIRSEIFISIKL